MRLFLVLALTLFGTAYAQQMGPSTNGLLADKDGNIVNLPTKLHKKTVEEKVKRYLTIDITKAHKYADQRVAKVEKNQGETDEQFAARKKFIKRKIVLQVVSSWLGVWERKTSGETEANLARAQAEAAKLKDIKDDSDPAALE